MAQLGIPQEYDAWLIDSDTEEPRLRLPWSAIRWQRVRNNISVASVSVAEADLGVGCCEALRFLFPWSTLLRIERNGQAVWDGPVTGWSRPSVAARGARGLTIRAHDRFVITMKRLVASNQFVDGDPTSILQLLMQEAGLGTAIDPFVFTVPTPAATADNVLREYKADRIERLFDAISELVSSVGLFYTQRTTETFIDEGAMRVSLGAAGERPKLTERTVIDVPGINVEGLNMVTVVYAGGASQGGSGFPLVGETAFWGGIYLTSTLEAGVTSQRASRIYDLQYDAIVEATRRATPDLSIEQTPLSPDFGGELVHPSLDNLLPGCLLDLDFTETCVFDLPFSGVGYVYRPWACETGSIFQLTPLLSDTIESVRIEQLDVDVTMSEGGVSENFLLSALPYAEWDGTLPAGWPCPPANDDPETDPIGQRQEFM